MCEGCGCHNAWRKPKREGKDVAPGQWHVHADGTAHRHEHGHDYRPLAAARPPDDGATTAGKAQD